MSERLFGTDGIRGLPGAPPLDDRTLRAVGRALGERLRGDTERPRVLIGMDTRESGPHIARQLAAGLAAAGAQPVSAGVITTPGVACLVRDNDFAAGIMVSASHNPYTDNGVKLLSHAGMKFPDEFEESLERRIAEAAESRGDGEFPLEPDPQFEERYLEFLRSRVPEAAGAAVAPGARTVKTVSAVQAVPATLAVTVVRPRSAVSGVRLIVNLPKVSLCATNSSGLPPSITRATSTSLSGG